MPGLSLLAWRSLASRPLRTLLTLLAVALGVAMLVAVTATNATIDASLQEAANRLVGNVDAEVRSFGGAGFTRQTADAILRLPEVERRGDDVLAAPTVHKRVFYRTDAGTQGFVELIGIDPAKARLMETFGVQQGVFLPTESMRNVMVLASWAKARNLAPGDFIQLISYTGLQPFQIVALLDDAGLGETGYGQVVYVSLRSGQELFNMADRVDRVALKLRPDATMPQLEADLRQIMQQDYLVVPAAERARGLRESVAALQYSLDLFGILPLLVGAFFILNSFQLSVAERQRELALLRVGGATPGQVMRLVLWEALWLGVVGSALGIILGVALAWVLVRALETSGEVRLLAWALPLTAILGGLAAGLVVTVLAALLPAANAARTAPLDVLRPRGALGALGGRPGWTGLAVLGLLAAIALLAAGVAAAEWRLLGAVGLVLLFVSVLALLPLLLGGLAALLNPLLRVLPGDSLLSARNLTRNRTRTTVTLTGLVVGFALTVGVGGLAESATRVGRDRAAALFAGRYAIISPVAQPGEFVTDFAKVPGVARVSPIRHFAALHDREIADVIALEPDAYASTPAQGRQDAAWRAALGALAAHGDGALVPGPLAAAWGVGPGSTLRLRANDRDVDIPVVGVIEPVFPSDDDRGAVIVPWATTLRWTGQDEWNYLNVLPAPGQAGPALGRALGDAAALYGLQAITTDQIAGSIQRSLERVVGLVNAMLGVGILIAALAILNTMLMNVYDRVHEIALLRATGMDPAQTARMVLFEAMAMGLVAMLVGSALGLGAGWLVLQLARSPEFQAPYVFPAPEILAALVVALVLVPLAGVYPARYAARLNVVDALTGMR
ncbi:MAG TPA: FtsX-like permease family protein [Chloroflexota bacterium]|nr:FtsX-like permease family protein [Chloroflexota bacterium]